MSKCCDNKPIDNQGDIEASSLNVLDGSVSAPSISFINDPDTGIYRVGTNELGITAGGVNKLSVNSIETITTNRIYQNLNNYPSVSGFYARDNDKQKAVSKITATRAVSTWITRTSAADNLWLNVCWAPEISLFVAVAENGINKIMTSPDGVVWTGRTAATTNNWISVCWSPELLLFVAVGFTGIGNRVMTSPDGITWTSRTSAADLIWLSVCWASELSLFVAVSETSGGVMTSPNGINWTLRTAPNNEWRCVIWAPELKLFVAVAESGIGNRVMTSPNGITWTSRTSAADNAWYSVCWAPEIGLLVAVSITGTGDRVMTSPDGIIWTSRVPASNNEWRGVSWSPEFKIFVATGDSTLMSSPDGITWSSRTPSSLNTWAGICWSPELSIFVCTAITGVGTRAMTSSFLDRLPTPANTFRGMLVASGNQLLPGYSFIEDNDTGMYYQSANVIGLSTGGVNRLQIQNNTIQTNVPMQAVAGALASAPSYGFQTTGGVGMYNSGNTLLFSSGNGQRMSIGNIINTNVQIGAPVVAATVPSYSFTGDPNTGFGSDTADVAYISAGGVSQLTVSTTNATFTNKVISPSLQITTTPTLGHILTSDASGNGTWQANAFTYTQPAWVPALVAGPNATLVSLINAQYTRIGNFVTGSLYFNTTVTALNTLTQVSILPPVAVPTQLICTGVVAKGESDWRLNSGICFAQGTVNIFMQFVTSTNVTTAFNANFSYHII